MSFVSNPLYSRASFGSADTSSCSGLGTSYTYDGLNRQLTAAAADGSITTHKYAADATSHTNHALEIDPAQHNRLHYTDGAGRLTEVDENVTAWQNGTYGISGQSTYKTTYAYNALDNLTGVTQGQQSRSFTYDSLKRLVQAINPESGTIKYVYDNSGNLSKRTDANGSAMNGAYDGLNRVTSKAYVPAVNVAETPTVTYTYGDGAQPSGCAANTQSSNLKGRLTCVAAGTLVNNYTGYDWAGRVLAHSQVTNGTTYSMAYGYDLAGELNSFQFPSGRQQSISYDNGGRPSDVTGTYQSASTAYAKLAGNDANSQSYGYFPNGAVQYMGVGPNALAQQNCQNGLLQITGVRLASSGSLTGNCVNGTSPDILNLALTYGAPVSNNGNLSAEQITTNDSPTALNVTQQFYYDAYNRVSLATETPTSSAPAVSSGSTCANLGLVGNVWCQQYGYDAPGNRWVSTNWTSGSNGYPLSPFAPTQQSNYNGNNQLLTTNASTATYDFAGNQQSLGGFGFTWDAESRLTQSTINSASTSYLYDGEGRRVNKSTTNTGGTFNTVYVYDAKGELVAEYSNEAAQASGTEYLTEDHLGSTRLVTTATGGIIKRYDFLPFGEDLTQGIGGRGTNYNAAIAIGPTQDVVNNKFTGHQRDNETGLDYFGARYFSGAQGRFTSPDWSPIPQPIPYADLSDPQTLNLYSYVRNNPLSRTDPDGHCCEEVEDLGRQITMAAPHPLVKLGGYIIIGVGIVATALTSPDVRAAAADSLTFASQHGGKSAAQQDMDDLSGRTVEQQTGKASGRAEALNDAKRDAGVPTSQQPEKQANVPMTDANGKQVVLDGKPQTSREYTHTTGSGEKVVIQDHSQGHSFPDGSKVGPHINVRPQGDTRHGTVPGTQPHYPYKKHGEN